MLLKIHAIKNSSKHIQAGLSVIKAFQNGTENRILVPKRKIAPNENCDKQLKFFSTRKKRKIADTNALSKPTILQSSNVKKTLQETEPMFCSKCINENDNTGDENIEWINCSKCSVWLHCSCAVPPITSSTPEDYICELCR